MIHRNEYKIVHGVCVYVYCIHTVNKLHTNCTWTTKWTQNNTFAIHLINNYILRRKSSHFLSVSCVCALCALHSHTLCMVPWKSYHFSFSLSLSLALAFSSFHFLFLWACVWGNELVLAELAICCLLYIFLFSASTLSLST